MKDSKFLILVFILALILRIGYIYFFVGFNAEEIRDGTFFYNVAVNISEGKGISLSNGSPTAKRPPLYLIFLGGLFYIFGPSMVAARFAQCIISALVSIIIFYIARELYPTPVDKIAAIFTACDPTLIFFCGRILAEPLLTLLIAVFVLLIVKIHNPNQYLYQFLAGIFLGFSILTRPLLGFLPFLIIFLPFLIWQKENKIKLFKMTAVLLLGLLIIYVPWVLRNYKIYKTFIPIATETGLTLWLSSHPEGKGYLKPHGLSPRFIPKNNIGKNQLEFPSTRNFIQDQPIGGLNEKEVDDKFVFLFLNWIKTHPLEYLKLIPKKLLGFWDGLYLFAPFDPMVVKNKFWIIIPFIFVMPLAIYGIIASFMEWQKFLIFYMMLISLHILILLTFADYRMRSIFMPYFFVFMGYGIIKIKENFNL